MKLAVLGSGSWGSALSIHFGRLGFEVLQWCREKKLADSINEKRGNPLYLKGYSYPVSVRAISRIEELFTQEVDVIFSVIPVQFTRKLWEKFARFIEHPKVVCASKGIEIATLETLSHVYMDIFKKRSNYYVLSGPTFAKEVAEGLPTAAVVAGYNERNTLELVKKLNSTSFRLYASTDVKGVEIGGALKNVIAIATGISDGMGLGNNARAALITRGLHEIKRLGKRLGAREETFYGLSGLGDLVLTCTGDLSRNRQFGLSIGRKMGKVDERYVVEGVHTVKAVKRLSEIYDVELPISTAVYEVVYEQMSPDDVMKKLLSRPVKEERY